MNLESSRPAATHRLACKVSREKTHSQSAPESDGGGRMDRMLGNVCFCKNSEDGQFRDPYGTRNQGQKTMSEQTDNPAKAGEKQDTKFKPGQSGNPAGKKPGTRHKVSLLAEKLMSDDVEKVTKSVIDAAVAGDMAACRLILDRIVPARKDATISIDLPEITTLEEASTAMQMIVKAAANAEIGLSEADALTKLVQGVSQAIEMTTVLQRLEALEARANL